MKTNYTLTKRLPTGAHKAPTGIAGLDGITGGGRPRGNPTVIEGGPGSGETGLALPSLVNGARRFNESGSLVGRSGVKSRPSAWNGARCSARRTPISKKDDSTRSG